jgi:MoxR-like ATPase
VAGPRTHTDLAGLQESAGRIRHNVEQVLTGKTEVVDLALVVLLAEGHLLIEDVPGVGKTMLAKALARSIDCSVRRIQFTPDLLPSDVTGVSIYNQDSREFEFKPGAIFANLVLGDEINRASPKTQSALLEAMEERQVSVDGVTYVLETPFMVIATQNPIEMEGTYPLPRRSATASPRGPRWATPPPPPSSTCWRCTARSTRSRTSSRSPMRSRSASWSRSCAACTSRTR